jgi:hypothetical protein
LQGQVGARTDAESADVGERGDGDAIAQGDVASQADKAIHPVDRCVVPRAVAEGGGTQVG